MASIVDKPSHIELTKTQPRETESHRFVVSKILDTVPNVRLIHLAAVPDQTPLKFCPGQWVDVHVPHVRQVGGFSITSTPLDLQRRGFIELAIQRAPQNPPAAWFWQPTENLTQKTIEVRVGGSFFWPPLHLHPASVRKVLLIAGGVGINPLISILSHLHQNPSRLPPGLELLYTHRHAYRSDLSDMSLSSTTLFLDRIRGLFGSPPFHSSLKKCQATLFMTASSDQNGHNLQIERARSPEHPPDNLVDGSLIETHFRRLTIQDLTRAMGRDTEARKGIVTYVCGPPALTDWATSELRNMAGVEPARVLYEKWW